MFAVCLIVSLAASVALNVDKFYRYVPEHVQPSMIAVTIGGLQKAESNTTVLVGKLANQNLCQVMQGFELNALRVLQFHEGSLIVQCPPDTQSAADAQVVPTKNVTILISPDEISFARSCRRQAQPTIVSPDKSETLWAITVSAAPGPPATFLTRLARQVSGMCPALAALPPS